MSVEGAVPAERLIVLCSTCGGAVGAHDAWPTCGEREPREHHADAAARLDEALLDQVDVALAAQAAMARRTAAKRIARAVKLNAEAASLRRRLRTQTMLLRTLRSKRQRAPRVADAIERVEEALERIAADEPPGSPWACGRSCPGTRLAERWLGACATERTGHVWAEVPIT